MFRLPFDPDPPPQEGPGLVGKLLGCAFLGVLLWCFWRLLMQLEWILF